MGLKSPFSAPRRHTSINELLEYFNQYLMYVKYIINAVYTIENRMQI
jgi:hypothetical protein